MLCIAFSWHVTHEWITNSGDVTLDWSPLFSVVKVAPDNSEYIVSNVVTVTVSLLYHGQKVGV